MLLLCSKKPDILVCFDRKAVLQENKKNKLLLNGAVVVALLVELPLPTPEIRF